MYNSCSICLCSLLPSWICIRKRATMIIFSLLFGWSMIITIAAEIRSYDLPALPSRKGITQAVGELNDPTFTTALALSANNTSTGIPKIFWVTMKHVQTGLNHREQLYESQPWIAETCERNPTWTFHMVDDERMNRFFAIVFANTSTLWAFQMINPALGATTLE